MNKPLEGIRVIDVTTNISGPSLTMILADLGAEVIKVERPSGDEARKMGPLLEGTGAYFLQINRNKKSIVIDLKQEKGRELLFKLIDTADIFVENLRKGKTEKLGLGYEQIKTVNPSLIYCSISAYGQEGPSSKKPGYDAIAQADAGILGINGSAGSELSRVPVSILDQGSALWGSIAILTALLQRKETGKGQRVTTSLYETGLFWMGYHLVSALATGEEPEKLGTNHASFAPYGAFSTNDSAIMIGISNDSLFQRFCKAIRKEEWMTDEKFSSNIVRVQNRIQLNALIEDVLKAETVDTWLTRFNEAGIPCSKVKTVKEVAKDSQTNALQMLQYVDHKQINDLQLTRMPIQFTEANVSIYKSPPQLGEDTKAILASLQLEDNIIEELFREGIIN